MLKPHILVSFGPLYRYLRLLSVKAPDALLELSAAVEWASNAAHMGGTCGKTSNRRQDVSVTQLRTHVCASPSKTREWKSWFCSNWGLFSHFKEDTCLACLPSTPQVWPQDHTTEHKCDTTVHKTKEPNNTRTIKTSRSVVRVVSLTRHAVSPVQVHHKGKSELCAGMRRKTTDNNSLLL